MSSPPDSLHDVEDAASKKRGRAQSVEPTPAPKDEAETDKAPSVSAPKKTKRDDECPNDDTLSRSNSVSTIRRNMKDMSTTDKSSTDTLDETMTVLSQEGTDGEDDYDHTMGTINEEGDMDTQQSQPHSGNSDNDSDNNKDGPHSADTNNSVSQVDADPHSSSSLSSTSNGSPTIGNQATTATKAFSQFGSKTNGNTDDWSEFADDDEQEDTPATSSTQNDSKPKYTFGSSSGFGTKGWASAHQTTPTTTQKATSSFSGLSGSSFGSSSFASPTQAPSSKSTSAFGAFAKAPTSSPFAMAAALGTSNALSSLPKITTPSTTTTPPTTTTTTTTTAVLLPDDPTTDHVTSPGHQDGQESTDDQKDTKVQRPVAHTETEHAFGEASKIKVPGVKQTKVRTGEEDEDTIYQTKAKLLVLDSATNNWKERGSGTFRINVKETHQARLVMRADSVYRLILNLLLFAEMKVFIMQDRFVRFAGFESETKEDGTLETKLVNYALKVSNPSAAQELHQQITSRIPSKAD